MVRNVSEAKIKEILDKFKNARFIHNGRDLKKGLDCLGFVILFYKEFGIEVPSDDGHAIEKHWYRKDPYRLIRGIMNLEGIYVKPEEVQPLDLVYFAVGSDVISHLGVMISNDKFAHMAPRSNLLVSSLKRHWLKRCRGAKRLIM
ncbi:MAG TPA: peptidoglycan endopeptidase [Clostridiales bacterium]|nr:peptidoglycan endopeptidase [Clostridiales bacterium]